MELSCGREARRVIASIASGPVDLAEVIGDRELHADRIVHGETDDGGGQRR